MDGGGLRLAWRLPPADPVEATPTSLPAVAAPLRVIVVERAAAAAR